MERSNQKLILYAVIGAVFVVGLLGRLMFNDLFGSSTLVLWARMEKRSTSRHLPSSRKAGSSVFVVQAFDCKELQVGDGELLTRMGLE